MFYQSHDRYAHRVSTPLNSIVVVEDFTQPYPSFHHAELEIGTSKMK